MLHGVPGTGPATTVRWAARLTGVNPAGYCTKVAVFARCKVTAAVGVLTTLGDCATAFGEESTAKCGEAIATLEPQEEAVGEPRTTRTVEGVALGDSRAVEQETNEAVELRR
mmetsp:Transcript_128593/g.359849  ORF Transcript_128593/g.359849 Transcript_128593/m.359849 type:complete len:112 (-) Transcript_128593:91-426(-)